MWPGCWIRTRMPTVSAATWLAQKTGALTGIGEKITAVQGLWQDIYNLKELPSAETLWDALFADGDVFFIGNLRAEVLLSPGHTLASVTYHIADAAFIHDTFFMPDSGTARADFPAEMRKPCGIRCSESEPACGYPPVYRP